tara:strand:- start:606 stop:1151 length:546 start_codon:yes stop_codon:yes gene_type:complete
MSSLNKTSIYTVLDDYEESGNNFIQDIKGLNFNSSYYTDLIDDTTGKVVFLPEINETSEIENSIENKINSLDTNMIAYLDASFDDISNNYDPSYVNLTQQYLNDKYDYLTLKEKEKISKTTNSYELLVAWTIIFFILLTSLLVFVLDDNIQLHLSVKIVLFLVCLYMFYFICMNIYGYFNK